VKPNLGLDFPNLPYLFHGDLKITESHAMMRYLANQFGPADFSGKDAKDKAIVDMILSVTQDIKNATVGHFYGTGDKEAIKKIAYERFSEVAKFLGEKHFIVGDYVTFVDFFIFEQVELFAFATEGEILVKHPNLAAYHKRITALPKFSEYYNSERFFKRPFNNKVAKINN
jgi:glutathione S-transferase